MKKQNLWNTILEVYKIRNLSEAPLGPTQVDTGTKLSKSLKDLGVNLQELHAALGMDPDLLHTSGKIYRELYYQYSNLLDSLYKTQYKNIIPHTSATTMSALHQQQYGGDVGTVPPAQKLK